MYIVICGTYPLNSTLSIIAQWMKILHITGNTQKQTFFHIYSIYKCHPGLLGEPVCDVNIVECSIGKNCAFLVWIQCFGVWVVDLFFLRNGALLLQFQIEVVVQNVWRKILSISGLKSMFCHFKVVHTHVWTCGPKLFSWTFMLHCICWHI